MTTKQCSKCKEHKDVSCFYTRPPRGRSTVRHRVSGCKDCNRPKVYKWRMENIDRLRVLERRSHLKRSYGITQEEFNAMLEKQNNKCAICGALHKSSVGNLVIDHAHIGGSVRGLLCKKCNSGIGFLKDDYATVRSAFEYLNQFVY